MSKKGRKMRVVSDVVPAGIPVPESMIKSLRSGSVAISSLAGLKTVLHTRVLATIFEKKITTTDSSGILKGTIFFKNEAVKEHFHITLLVSPFSEFEVSEGQVWVCEADLSRPIAHSAKFHHTSGITNVSLTVNCLPLCRIKIPDEISFTDISPNGNSCYFEKQGKPEGVTLAFVPDLVTEPRPGNVGAWKVRRVTEIVVNLGEGEKQELVLAIECPERVVHKPSSPEAQAWRRFGVLNQ